MVTQAQSTVLEERDRSYLFEEGGRRFEYARVTACLEVLWPNRPTSEEALFRGRYVHKACALLDGGLDGSGLDWDSVLPEYRPRLGAWDYFKDLSGFEPVAIELFVWSHERRFAGRLDRICRLPKLKAPLSDPKGLWVLDLKTSEEAWAGEGAQTAAYEFAYREVTGYRGKMRRLSVHLHANGKPSMEEWKDPADLSTFLAAHHVIHWWRRHRLEPLNGNR